MNSIIYGISKARECRKRKSWSKREIDRLLPDYTGRLIWITVMVGTFALVGLFWLMESL